MREAGLEPAWKTPPDPKSGASAIPPPPLLYLGLLLINNLEPVGFEPTTLRLPA